MTGRRTKALFAAVALTFLAGLALSGEKRSTSIKSIEYIAHDVVGEVKVWTPWAPFWRRVVAERRLPAQSLMSVGPGSSVVLEKRGHAVFGDMQGDRATLSIATPLVFRIEPDLFRKVRLRSFFIEKMPDVQQVPPDDVKDVLNQMYVSMREAFDRFAAFFVGDASKMDQQSVFEAVAEAGRINAGLTARNLKLILPGDNKLILAGGIPTTLETLWERPAEDARQFAVYFWKAGTQRGDPVVFTRETRHTLTALEEGTFFIQVSSVDGRFMSKVKVVHVAVLSAQTLATSTRGMTTTGVEAVMGVTTLAPPDQYQVVPHGAEAMVTFAWEAGLMEAAESDFEVVVRDSTGKELVRHRAREPMATISLPPGHYHWHVSVMAFAEAGESAAVIRSEDRELTVGGAMEDVLRTSENRVVYWENGI